MAAASAGTGSSVSGEMLHIGMIRLPQGGTLARHCHGSEQFSYVLRGTLEVELAGELYRVPHGHANTSLRRRAIA